MRDMENPTARLLAPAALAAFFVVLVIVVFTSLGNGDQGASQAPTGGSETTRGAATYVVRPGDTLSGIADRTGVSVERLNLLNPDIDPQALISGRRLRLR
jgi:LysM repeat protein